MNKVVFEGKTYVKASVLARELGYTTDYVGQLCRAGKVSCQLVGRSWYVEAKSLQDHKSNRYRSTKSKSKKAIREHRAPLVSDDDSESISHFYNHSPRKQLTHIRYDSDDAELVPVPRKETDMQSTKLPVELADAKEVSVSSKSPTYNFEAPARENIKFYGTLRVTDVLDDPEVPKETPDEKVQEDVVHELEVLSPKEKVAHIPVHKKVVPKKVASRPAHIHTKSGKALAMRRKSSVQPLVLPKRLQQEEALEQTPTHLGFTLTVTALTSCALVLLILGFEVQIVFLQDSTLVSYEFVADNITALLYTAI